VKKVREFSKDLQKMIGKKSLGVEKLFKSIPISN
jgi:hypothetical protein